MQSDTRNNKRIHDLLTVEQAASALGISVATLWRWVAASRRSERGAVHLQPMTVLGRTVFDRDHIEALARKRHAAG